MPSRALPIEWSAHAPPQLPTATTLRAWLDQELSADRAVRIAIANSHSLRAAFQEIGVAEADLVQAGLIPNPVVEAHVLFQDGAGVADTGVSIKQNIFDIFVASSRQRIEEARVQHARWHVSHVLVILVADVEEAHYTLQGASHIHTLQRSVLQAADAALEIARRQRSAGNISELELTERQAVLYEAKVALIESKTAMVLARERLAELLGISGLNLTLNVRKTLPDLPAGHIPLDNLIDTALVQRPDLLAARQQTEILQRSLGLSDPALHTLSHVEVHITREKEAIEEQPVTGPSVSFPLPLIDHQQGVRGRLEAKRRQSQHHVMAMENHIRSEVLGVIAQMQAARRKAEYYRDVVIPNTEAMVRLMQKHYNFMLHGVYALLESTREELSARRASIEALQAYWIARSALERAIGGPLNNSSRHKGR